MNDLTKIFSNVISLDHQESLNELHYEFFQNLNSEATKKSYFIDISQFFNFCFKLINGKFKSFKDVRRSFVIAYKNNLTNSDLAPKTICRKLSSLSSYFDFLVEKGLIEQNPCNGVKRPKQTVKNQTNDLSDQQVSEIFISVSNGPLLHQLVILLLFTTGLRKSEIINLKLSDIQCKNDEIYLRVRVKGGKYLLKFIPDIVVDKLMEYLEENPIDCEDGFLLRPSKNPLNPGKLNKGLNPKSVDYILKKYARSADIYERISPHSARASYIGSALENGADLYRLSLDVGHSSVKTTQSYNKRELFSKKGVSEHLGFLKDKKVS